MPAPASTALAFVSPSAAVIAERPPRLARSIIWVVCTLFTCIVGLGAFFAIDRVVVARARLVSVDPTVTVQPLEAAIVRSVAVKVNQAVRAGEVLAFLDATFATADASALEAQAANLQAEVARLDAEAAARPYAAEPNPYSALQSAIFAQRQAEHGFRVENYRLRMDSLQANLERARDEAARLRQRLAVATEIEGMRRELERGQIGSRLNSLVASDGRIEVSRALAVSEGQAKSLARDLEALRAERDAYVTQWRGQVSQDLSDRRASLADVLESLNKARLRRSLVQLTAPVDGVVLELGKSAPGAVLQPGETLVTLVPANARLEAEAEVQARDMGYVAIGDRVELKFDTFPYTRHGTARGMVRTLSEDAIAPDAGDRDRAPFYRARIALDSLEGLRDLPPDFRPIPGMPITADIVVGERTVLGYLFNRIVRPIKEGMREP